MLSTEDLVTKVSHKFKAVWFQMRSVDAPFEALIVGIK